VDQERAPVTRHVEAVYDPEKGRLRLEWSRNEKATKPYKGEVYRAIVMFAWIVAVGFLIASMFGVLTA
jgi:hypothetical protein